MKRLASTIALGLLAGTAALSAGAREPNYLPSWPPSLEDPTRPLVVSGAAVTPNACVALVWRGKAFRQRVRPGSDRLVPRGRPVPPPPCTVLTK